eukprot:3440128-Pyramimonas_sp.AAC.1
MSGSYIHALLSASIPRATTRLGGARWYPDLDLRMREPCLPAPSIEMRVQTDRVEEECPEE